MAHTSCMLNKQGYMHVCASTRPRARVQTCTHAQDAHRDKYVILIAFTQQQWFCGRASTLRHTYIACIVKISYYFTH